MFKEKFYYFAYGSNMSYERLYKRIGKCKKIGNYNLEGYELTFNYGNEKESFANLKENEQKSVEGVVYEITLKQLHLLDYYEGNNNPNYYYRMCDIYKNKALHFYISFNTRKEFLKPISIVYYKYLLEGCIENNLHNYKKYLQTISKFINYN